MRQAAPNDEQVRSLIRSARQVGKQGRAFEAENLRRQAESIAPRHPLVLNETAMRLLRAGQPREANKLLAEAAKAEPTNTEILYHHAIALRSLGSMENATEVLRRLLIIEAGHMGALFEKGSIEEQQGDSRAAAVTYQTIVRMLPANFTAPQWMEAPLRHAKEVVEANNRALESYIEEGLKPLRTQYASQPLRRFEQCLQTMLQKRKSFRQQPAFMYYPELPAIEFYDREDFPWLDDLEAAADDIRNEILTVLNDGKSVLDPYVADQPGLDVKYYKELNRSRRWGVYPLWREGVEFPDHIEKCPKTAAALKNWPKWNVPGSGPTALFSILDAKTRIPAHTGPVNTRLVVHLALVVPPGCGFRVGGQVREWEPGKAFVFDDSIIHEAWNDSKETRAVLIADIWTPLLTKAERELIRALTARMHAWYGPASSRDLKSPNTRTERERTERSREP
ncbi:MAG TPA: aspartyl/asparaginyl beta-hydroxylase domain-containing protein [Rhizomicrobium sp.]|jgi:aspartyl/asparaginyl beta-hydroxylase (cupin superfamily)/Flp pilus assembly protein TadD|nr:aspartyl/asparaginyl beta-hydroxylase domain-containing protein [Rhizomicrobium sp.]